jgi:hypothetical protein
MKRFQLLFIISLLISVNVYAQLNKKMWLVGGSGSFRSYKQDYNSPLPTPALHWNVVNNEFVVSAKVGYFFYNKLVFGITPTFSYLKSKNTSYPISENSNRFLIGPFARYYFLNKNKPFNILAEVNYQLGIQNSIVSPKDKGSLSNYSIFVGPEIFFNPTVGIEVLLGYKASKETFNDSYNPHTDIRKGFQVSVGFQVHLKYFKTNTL